MKQANIKVSYERNLFLRDLAKEIERTKRYNLNSALFFVRIKPDSSRDTISKFTFIAQENLRTSDSVYQFSDSEAAFIIPHIDFNQTVDLISRRIKDAAKQVYCCSHKCFSISVTRLAKDSLQGKTTFDVIDETLLKLKNSPTTITIQPGKKETPKPEPVDHKRKTIYGTPISEGIATGKAFIYRDIFSGRIPYKNISSQDLESEYSRLREAFKHVKSEISEMSRFMNENYGRKYSDIFHVHLAILSDPKLIFKLKEEIKNSGMNAEHSVTTVFGRYQNRLKFSESKIFQERADDIEDLSRRILSHLSNSGIEKLAVLPKNTIVIAERLLPSNTVHLKKSSVNAVITEKGSKCSHAALLTRSLGIPYIAKIKAKIDEIMPGSELIVDSNKGRIIINPDKNEKQKFDSLIKKENQKTRETIKNAKETVLENNNRRYYVNLNASSKEEITTAKKFGFDSLGLFRLEQIYLKNKMPLTEEQLIKRLNSTFENIKNKSITVRLLDLGGDKNIQGLSLPGEKDSFLGTRGIRLLLKNPEILKPQLRALLKLRNKFKIKILIPMVTLPSEVNSVKKLLNECRHIMNKQKTAPKEHIEVGAMIETPATAVQISNILKEADFVSIGSNDLIQYVMASDRNDDSLAGYYDAGVPVILDLVKTIADKSKKAGKECSLCGELAAETKYTSRLIKKGLEIFSVSGPNIPKVKNQISSIIHKKT